MSIIDSRTREEILNDDLWKSLADSGKLDSLVIEKMKKRNKKNLTFAITDEKGNPIQDKEIVEDVDRVNNEFKRLLEKALT